MTQHPNSPTLSQLLDEFIRVDHAGEKGAKRIYEGQLKALKDHPSQSVIHQMYEQELAHLATFEELMKAHKVRPTLLSPLWDRAAYGLGWVSGKLGVKTAMAVTVAVEEVIDQHYAQQINALKDFPFHHQLAETLEQFRQQEIHHRDQGLNHQAEHAPFYPFLKLAVKAVTKLAIGLSKKI